MARSKIEWTDYTFNPWIGCTKVSSGCKNCYAERENKFRKWTDGWGPGAPRKRTSPANWKAPILWDMTRWFVCPECGWRGPEGETALSNFGEPRCPACECGNGLMETRARVFCASLADVFDEEVPDTWRDDLRRLMRSTPYLDWLILTKRVEKMVDYFDKEPFFFMGSNLWLGVSVEDQKTADYRIPYLFRVHAEKKFVSFEPALEKVDFRPYLLADPDRPNWSRLNSLHWIIVGGESGPGARPMHPDWARLTRDQCKDAGVAFTFKQWGEWLFENQLVQAGFTQLPECEHINTNGGFTYYRVGKKAAGRMLDGREWNEFPEVKE